MTDFIYTLYNDKRTVFTLPEIALLLNESNFLRLKQRINYYVRNKKIESIRKGIYVKPLFNKEELACKIYAPSYLSLEYVLQKEGIIFQFSNTLTVVSYLSRAIEVDNTTIQLSKLKSAILLNSSGIVRDDTGVNIATKERAILDILYLKQDYYFDFIDTINEKILLELLPLYESKALEKRVKKLNNGGHK